MSAASSRVGQAAQPAAGGELAEAGPGLDRELVERQMVDRHRERRGRAPPASRRGSGPGGRRSDRSSPARRSPRATSKAADRLGGVVHPAERPQVGVVERLHPHRQPVDPGVAVAAEAARLHRGRVGLERDLGVRRQASSLRRSPRCTAATVSGGIRLGVPPPKKTRVDRRVPGRARAAASISATSARRQRAGVDAARGRGC